MFFITDEERKWSYVLYRHRFPAKTKTFFQLGLRNRTGKVKRVPVYHDYKCCERVFWHVMTASDYVVMGAPGERWAYDDAYTHRKPEKIITPFHAGRLKEELDG